MNKKTITVIFFTVVFVVLVLMAIMSGLKGNDKAYSGAVVPTKTALEEPEKTTTMSEQEPEANATATAPSATIEEATNDEAITTMTKKDVSTVEETASVMEDVASKAKKEVSEIKEPVVTKIPTEKEETPKENEKEGALYSVVDGNKLDAKSYAGFKLFRNWCSRCHGTYGQGLVGPNLADSLKVISEKQFFDTVKNGKTGQIGSMPTWKKNVKVMEGRDKLYAYLMARSDGAIGVVKPKKQ